MDNLTATFNIVNQELRSTTTNKVTPFSISDILQGFSPKHCQEQALDMSRKTDKLSCGPIGMFEP